MKSGNFKNKIRPSDQSVMPKRPLYPITEKWHITTLITGIILFQFGTGPIKGFAVTLCIGILTSVFSALVVTRLLMQLYPGERPVQLSI